MAERESGVGGGVGKILERFAEGLPGFALTTIVVGAVLPKFAPAELRDLYPVLTVGLAYISQFLGHYFDKPFQPIWGAKPSRRFRDLESIGKLDKTRTALAREWKQPVTGIYAKASQILRKTEAWDKKAKWPLEISKACRSLFIIDAIVVIVKWFTNRELIGLLLAAAPLLLVAYMTLRIEHVTNLYAAAMDVEYKFRNGFLCIAQSAIPARRVLLWTEDPAVKSISFGKAQLLVMSLALMHVDLSIFRGTKSPDWKFEDEMVLHPGWINPLQRMDRVYTAGQENAALLPNPTAPQSFDLLLTLTTKSAANTKDEKEVRNIQRELIERLNSGLREPKPDTKQAKKLKAHN